MVIEIDEIKALDNGEKIEDEFGNYWYKNGDNDYRFYHIIDTENEIYDEDRYTLNELLNMCKIVTIEMAQNNIGKKCRKLSNKPFKSGFKVNTIKGIAFMEVPSKDKKSIIKRVCYSFVEDDSIVSAEICHIVDDDDAKALNNQIN